MEHLYKTIRNKIKRQILEGIYPAGGRLPGSRELSADFQTTSVTIDRALALLVDEGLVKRIPKSGTFVTKPEERHEPSLEEATPGGLIGVIAFETAISVYWSAVVKAMEDALLGFGFHLVVGHSDGNMDRTLRYIDDLCAKGIEGFIYIPLTIPHWTEAHYEHNNAQVIDRLDKAGVPFVLFDRFVSSRKASGVAVQNYEYSKLLVQKLLGLGVRHPLCLSSAYSLTSDERERGFVDACLEAGFEHPDSLVQRVEVDRITHANYDLLEPFVEDAAVDGFFTINSSLGNGLVDVLAGHAEHASTPMVGFEDFDMRNRHRFAHVAKSSVYDTGFAAGELLVCKIREKKYTLFQGSPTKQGPALEVRFPCRIETPRTKT